jgi:hypothetical protein
MTMPAVELRKPFELLHQEEELTKQQQLQVDALRSIDPLVVSEAEFHLAAQVRSDLLNSRAVLIVAGFFYLVGPLR